jgi:hypothetical protein
MRTRSHLFRASFQGSDLATAVRRIVSRRPEFATPPARVTIDHRRVTATATWLEEGLERARRSLLADWFPDDDDSPALIIASRDEGRPTGAVKVQLRTEWSIPCVVEFAQALEAWLAVFDSLHDDEGWRRRENLGIAGGHTFPGWGCLFAGERGHEQFVSRRWLEHGPWLLHRFPGDVSLIQFHDLDADSETALAQALVGHRRLGDHQTGGYLRTGYVPNGEIGGLYVAGDQTLRIVCPPGREVTQGEMLDACAERLVGRYNTEKPIRAVRYVFIEPADAQRHLHEMWLRELEVWTFTPDGKEIRIDSDYNPIPTRPAWVQTVEDA